MRHPEQVDLKCLDSPIQLLWLALVIELSGNFYYKNDRTGVCLAINLHNKFVAQKVGELLERKVWTAAYRKNTYRVALHGRKAVLLLSRLYKYFSPEKKSKAMLYILKKKYRKDIYKLVEPGGIVGKVEKINRGNTERKERRKYERAVEKEAVCIVCQKVFLYKYGANRRCCSVACKDINFGKMVKERGF